MRGARIRDEKLCSCAGWRFNCGGAIITANTVVAARTLTDCDPDPVNEIQEDDDELNSNEVVLEDNC